MCGSCCVRPSWFFLLFRKTRRWFLWLVRRLICRNICQRASIFRRRASVLTSAFLCVSRPLAFSSRQHKRNTSTKQQEENNNSKFHHVAWIVYRDSLSVNTWNCAPYCFSQRVVTRCENSSPASWSNCVLDSLKRFSGPSHDTMLSGIHFQNLSIGLMDYQNHVCVSCDNIGTRPI